MRVRRLTAPIALTFFLLPIAHALAAAPEEPLPKTLAGKVVLIADGDTVTVLVDEKQHRIRVDAIDCPERGQAFGNRARQFTSKHVSERREDGVMARKSCFVGLVGAVVLFGGVGPVEGRATVIYSTGFSSDAGWTISTCKSGPFPEGDGR